MQEAQVGQLAVASKPIPELTSSCEELRAALGGVLSSSVMVLKSSAVAVGGAAATSSSTARATHTTSIKATASAAAASTAPAPAPPSPTCQHVAHLSATASCGGGSGSCGRCAASPPSCHGHCHCCRHGSAPAGAAAAPSRLWEVGLAPAADKLQLRIQQLDRDLRCVCGALQARVRVRRRLAN
jgi:hypothetical protein